MARRRRHRLGNDGLEGAFSDPSVAGPLLGGGLTQAASLATRMLFKKPSMVKWSPVIGLLVGGGASAALLFTRHKQTGLAGLITSALIAVPAQLERALNMPAKTAGYLGVITTEQEMAGAFGYEDGGYSDDGMNDAFGADLSQDIQLLDGGSGSTGVLGVITPEREMDGMSGAFGAGGFGANNDVELLGFGSNFLSQ